MKNLSELKDIVSEYKEYAPNLEVVETTSERSGYPRHIIPAIIGFESWDQAELFCDENPDFQLIWLDRRDGWNLWHRGNTAVVPLDIERDLEEKGELLKTPDEALESIKSNLESADTLDELYDMLDKYSSLCTAVNDLDDDEAIFLQNGIWDVVKIKDVIEWHEDVYHTVLAAIAEF